MLGQELEAPLDRRRQRPLAVVEVARAVSGEGIGLASAAIQGEHALVVHALAQGVGGDQRLDIGQHLPVAAQSEVALDALLGRLQAQLLQPHRFGAGERLVLHVGHGRAVPQRQRPLEHAPGTVAVTAQSQVAALAGEGLEALGVELVSGDLEPVAAGVVTDATRIAQRLAQRRHVDLHAACGPGPALAAPHVLDQALGRDHLAAVDQQRRQQRALLVTSQRTDLTVRAHLEWPQDPDVEFHLTTILSDS